MQKTLRTLSLVLTAALLEPSVVAMHGEIQPAVKDQQILIRQQGQTPSGIYNLRRQPPEKNHSQPRKPRVKSALSETVAAK